MTSLNFGQMLKELVSVSGIRITHLANELGYDSSYLSRWLSGAKTPSLRNNSNLFSKISDAIICCSSNMGLEALLQKYGCAEENLGETIEILLRDAFAEPEQREPIAAYIDRNAAFFSGEKNTSAYNRVFHDAFEAAAASGRDMVECICGTALSVNGNKTKDFFEYVLPEDAGYKIMIHQLVDMDDFDRNVDICCAAICTFTRYSTNVMYTFYEYHPVDSNIRLHSYMHIESTLQHIVYENPLTQKIDTIMNFCGSTLESDFSYLKMRLSFLPKILKFCTHADTADNLQFLYNYAMDGDMRYFLVQMNPVYMSSELTLRIAERHDIILEPDDFTFQYNNVCANTEKEVIMYNSALLNYIYSGEICILGRTVILDVEERLEHLEQLLKYIESGKCRIWLLNDVNMLLNREDTKLSFFLGRKSGFMVEHNGNTPIIRFRSVQIVEYFNCFFSHFLSLGENHIKTPDQTMSFIRRGIEIIRTLE